MNLDKAAIIISLASLYISVRIAWETIFRPARIVAVMPHCVMWQFSSWKGDRPTGEVVSRQITPYLRIRNFGAKPIVIEDLRISFVSKNSCVRAYPVSKVSEDVIEAPGNNQRQYGLGEGAPFSGIALSSNEEWKNSYAFSMNLKDYEILVGEVEVSVEIRVGGNKNWKVVHKDRFSFGTMPYHLRALKTETTTTGSTSNHVYSSRWEESRSYEH